MSPPHVMSTHLDSVGASLDELARIGGGPDGGVTRVAWSPELFAAYAWVGERMRELGLEVEIDAAGNLLARWDAGSGSPVLVGSHLDTVPSGGRFDGVLGVVAALHAVAALKAEGFEPERPLWIVAFMDEEGTRFDAALFGSRAFSGEDVTGLGDRADANGITLREAMARSAATTSTGQAMPIGWPRSAPTSSCTSSRGRCSRRRGSRSASSRRSSGCAATASGSPARRTTPARRRCGSAATRSPARRGSRSSCARRRARAKP